VTTAGGEHNLKCTTASPATPRFQHAAVANLS
jgi:hypothetical protein